MAAAADRMHAHGEMPENLMDLTGRVAVVSSAARPDWAASWRSAWPAPAPTSSPPAAARRWWTKSARKWSAPAAGRCARVCDIGFARSRWTQFRDAVLAEFGQVDVLVNAAGQIFRKPTHGHQRGRMGWPDGRQPHRHAAHLPVVLPGAGRQPARPHHQYRVAEFLRGAGAGHRVRRFEGRRCSRSRAAWRWNGRRAA